MNTFVCPFCGAQCPTLLDLLTCHPQPLRACTDHLASEESYLNMTMAELVAPLRPRPFPKPIRDELDAWRVA